MDNLNGNDNNNGDQAAPFGTIGKAFTKAVSGDTVNVVGQVCGGIPFGYTDDTHQSNYESFPLHVPSGVTVKGVLGQGSSGIYVWTVQSGTAALFQFDDLQGDNLNAALKKMALIGGEKGVLIQAANGGTVSPTIGTVTFSHNTEGIHVQAQDDGVAAVTIQNCTISDALPVIDPLSCPGLMGPAAVGMQYGIRLKAVESASGVPGGIMASLTNLSTSGIFSRGSGSDYENLVFLTATGKNQKQHGSSFDDISRIDLTVNGGTWNGKATDDPFPAGWLRGLKVKLDTPPFGNRVLDYTARVFVTFNGTLIKNFRKQGIKAVTADDSRCQLALNGQTKVTGIGKQLGTARGADPDLQSNILDPEGVGLLLHAKEGYLSLEGTDPEISGNNNDGIYLLASATDPNLDMRWPVGAWIGLTSAKIHNNLGDECHLEGVSGITGGTWSFLNDGTRVIITTPELLDESLDPSLQWGQGFLDRCAISNNGTQPADSGIRIDLLNSSAIGALRVVNDIVWNNTSHGVVFFNEDDSQSPSPTMIAPIIQCTVAGDLADNFAVESTGGGLSSNFNYQWFVQTPKEDLWTRIYDSIFERQDSGLLDLNQEAESLLFADPDPPGTNTKTIYADALRVYLTNGSNNPFYNGGQGGLNTLLATPFLVKPPDWASTDPTQLFLNGNDTQTLPKFKDLTRTDLGPLTERLADHDFSGNPRPGISHGKRDKGAEEL